MAVTPFTVIPSRLRPSTFSVDMDQFLSELDEKMGQVASVEQSLQLVATTGTSTTAISVGTGSRTLTTQPGKAWVVGAFVYLAYPSDLGNLMYGQITAYNALTGSLTVNVTYALGSGNLGSWVIGLSVPSSGSPAFSGPVTVSDDPANGCVRLVSGNATKSGYLELVLPGGTSAGYIGWAEAGQYIELGAYGTLRYQFNKAPSSAVAATSATELVRKAELDAATGPATTSQAGTVVLADVSTAQGGSDGSKAVTSAAMAAAAIGGSWQSMVNVTGSRDIAGSTFTNNTGRRIDCHVTIRLPAATGAGAGVYEIFVAGNSIGVVTVGDANGSAAGVDTRMITFSVPPWATYRIPYVSGGVCVLVNWTEMR